MINLIPAKAKKKLIFEYWVRVLSVWMMLGSAVLLLGAGILFPAYVLIGVQISAIEADASLAAENVTEYENVSVELVQASEHARFIKDESDYQNFSSYIDLFHDLKGNSIEIKSILLSREEGEIKPITLAGEANDRQSLASFRDRLLASEVITAVDLPISNLARDRNIPFTVPITIDNEIDI